MSITDTQSIELVEAALRRHGRARIVALGESMRPFIPPGSSLEVRAGPAPRRGDVALVRLPGGLAAHRVIDAGSAGVRTRGDAHACADPRVDAGDVLGVVVAVHFGRLRVPLDGVLGRAFGRLLATPTAGRVLPRAVRTARRVHARLARLPPR